MKTWGKVAAGVVLGVAGTIYATSEEARAVQVRYNSGPVPCRVDRDGEGWVARLEEPVMGVAAGQSAVFYTGDGERVVAGGVVRWGE